MRRTQQRDCYAAEAVVPRGRAFASVDEAQRWVDDLRDQPWWDLQGYSLHVLRVEVEPLPQSAKFLGEAVWDASRSCGVIGLRHDGLRELIALHEVAHVLADAVHKSTGHDPAWARVFLTLVSQVLGADAYLKLQRSFDEHGVCYDAARSPQAGGIAL